MKKKPDEDIPEVLNRTADVVLNYRPKDKQHKPPKKKKKNAKTSSKS
jgi:hypothetical protein